MTKETKADLELELSESTKNVEELTFVLKRIYGINPLLFIQTPGKGPANVKALNEAKKLAKKALERQGVVLETA